MKLIKKFLLNFIYWLIWWAICYKFIDPQPTNGKYVFRIVFMAFWMAIIFMALVPPLTRLLNKLFTKQPK